MLLHGLTPLRMTDNISSETVSLNWGAEQNPMNFTEPNIMEQSRHRSIAVTREYRRVRNLRRRGGAAGCVGL